MSENEVTSKQRRIILTSLAVAVVAVGGVAGLAHSHHQSPFVGLSEGTTETKVSSNSPAIQAATDPTNSLNRLMTTHGDAWFHACSDASGVWESMVGEPGVACVVQVDGREFKVTEPLTKREITAWNLRQNILRQRSSEHVHDPNLYTDDPYAPKTKDEGTHPGRSVGPSGEVPEGCQRIGRSVIC